MWFRRRPRESVRADRWAAFASRIGAVAADDVAERLRRFLDLDEAEVRHAHALKRTDAPAVYLFDVVRRRRGPTGEAVRWSAWCLLRGERPLAPVSFRATARREAVLESLEASRSGAVRVDLGAFPEVDAALAVFARDAAAVRAALTPPVTIALARLVAAGPGAVVTVGERHVIGHVDVEEAGDPAELQPLADGLLDLAARLSDAVPVAIDEDDFLLPG
ncbi:MAG: hypothetical protein ABR510_00325 [Trueperaceae bacterium]